MTKDHYLPRLIIRNFVDSSGKIYFYNKKEKKIFGPFPHYDQLQENSFYSNKPISELKRIFHHIDINPIFQKEELDLDKNIQLFLESPVGGVLSRIIREIASGELPKINDEEHNLIKEYFVIQHLRTPTFKSVSEEVRSHPLKLPSNTKDLVMGFVNSRPVNFKEVIKNKFPNLNSKQRRVKVVEAQRKLKKRLKHDPDFIKNIKNSRKTEEIIGEEMIRAEEEIEKIRNHPDKHSSEILDNKIRERFLKRFEFDKRNIKFIINKTVVPFVLSDTGKAMICWDYGYKKEMHFYLPMHPQILIEFCNDSEPVEYVDKDYVKEFNQISLDDSLINVYSSSDKSLNLLES